MQLDAGRAYDGNRPPAELSFGDIKVPNFRKDGPPVTVLGRTQKQWLKRTLSTSKATWKVWAVTNAPLEMRADLQNLPTGMTDPWPGAGYAYLSGGDFSAAYTERGEIYDHVRTFGIDGLVTVSGDRHAFFAGYASKSLPPAKFEPVGVSFVTGSISAPGTVEAFEHSFPKDHVLRPLLLADRAGEAKPEATINLLVHRGVKSALEYAKSGDIDKARALTDNALAPHITFADLGGHGYSVVTAASDAVETEFVCIPRPITRATTEDGGPLRYRVVHHTKRWSAGSAPQMESRVVEGDAKLSM
jgi:alkaline phosphatase D